VYRTLSCLIGILHQRELGMLTVPVWLSCKFRDMSSADRLSEVLHPPGCILRMTWLGLQSPSLLLSFPFPFPLPFELPSSIQLSRINSPVSIERTGTLFTPPRDRPTLGLLLTPGCGGCKGGGEGIQLWLLF
jgi:hypothetical protein